MKYLIASDIHGSAYYCRKLLDAFEREKADRLILLGDLLYHGPRNNLPEGHDPKAVIAMLNGLKDKIFCVRGNCDTEVDQMVLEFPVMAEYALMETNGRLIMLTHGHHYGIDNVPLCVDVMINGHTHVPLCEERNGVLCLNCGSVSLPKQNSAHSYMTLEDGVFEWKDLDGAEFMRRAL